MGATEETVKDALEKSGLHTNKKRDWYNRGLLTGGVKY